MDGAGGSRPCSRCRAGRGARAGRWRCVRALPPPRPRGQETRPYQTLLVQIFCSLTTSPVFGACQIFPFPA